MKGEVRRQLLRSARTPFDFIRENRRILTATWGDHTPYRLNDFGGVRLAY